MSDLQNLEASVAKCGELGFPLDTQLQGDGWTIHYDPPPIPIRTCDWHFVHEGYDGPGNWRHGDAASPEECVTAIRELEEMHQCDM